MRCGGSSNLWLMIVFKKARLSPPFHRDVFTFDAISSPLTQVIVVHPPMRLLFCLLCAYEVTFFLPTGHFWLRSVVVE
jgi:hypothetical protein